MGVTKEINCPQRLFSLGLCYSEVEIQLAGHTESSPHPLLLTHIYTSRQKGEQGSETKSVPCEPLVNIVVKGLSGKKADAKNIELSLSQFLVSLTAIQKLT